MFRSESLDNDISLEIKACSGGVTVIMFKSNSFFPV